MVKFFQSPLLRAVDSCVPGILYEMGGTWVTHHMAFLFKEMIRYGMDRDLLLTHHSGYENDYYTLNVPGRRLFSSLLIERVTEKRYRRNSPQALP